MSPVALQELKQYQGNVKPVWCPGCGDFSVLTAMYQALAELKLDPAKVVIASGIGCSGRFPAYVNGYGFHGIHGRALPLAEGIRMARPDLHVFVNTGDGDCCSIGAAHWIHAVRYNMRMSVFLHDNQIYGLTKKQASPTSPRGTKSNTTPRGSSLEALNPLTVTLGVQNVSFVAQAVDWMPDALYDIVRAAFHHKGLSFVRIIQRCPEWLPDQWEPFIKDPKRSLRLDKSGHDASDLHRAREIASQTDPIPVGILYRNPEVPCYEELRASPKLRTAQMVRGGLEAELDKFTVWPEHAR